MDSAQDRRWGDAGNRQGPGRVADQIRWRRRGPGMVGRTGVGLVSVIEAAWAELRNRPCRVCAHVAPLVAFALLYVFRADVWGLIARL